jgi:hypothetical protein
MCHRLCARERDNEKVKVFISNSVWYLPKKNKNQVISCFDEPNHKGRMKPRSSKNSLEIYTRMCSAALFPAEPLSVGEGGC